MVMATSAAQFTAIPATPQASRAADSMAVAALQAADGVKQTFPELDLTMASSRFLEAIFIQQMISCALTLHIKRTGLRAQLH
jgi:hypothetical protein